MHFVATVTRAGSTRARARPAATTSSVPYPSAVSMKSMPASSTLATTVLLRSSQTAVLGGLKSKVESDTTTQLPLLGDIPLLGYLFKEKSTQETTSTLLVFITPTILRSPEDQEQSMRKLLEEKIRDYGAGLAAQREAIFGKDGK